LGGSMRYGDPDYAGMMMPETQQVRVDGRGKRVDRTLGALLGTSISAETGVEMPDATRSAA
jgi:hypothetical protein